MTAQLALVTLTDGDPCPRCTYALAVDREGTTVHSAHCICCGLDLLTPRDAAHDRKATA